LKLVRIILLSLAGLIVVAAAAAGAISWLADRKMHRTVELPPLQASFAAAPGQLEHGRYLFQTRGCMECHGADGGGHKFVDDKESGFFVHAPNITGGSTSPARSYTDADWVRVLRHGVKPSGQPVIIMPSEDFAQMVDADIAAIAAYARSLPPVDTAGERSSPWPLPLKALYLFGAMQDAAEKIDHRRAVPQAVPDDPVARGRYIAQGCTGCHGPGMSGGKIPGVPPSWPAAANLTTAPDSAMARYDSAAQFNEMMRSGRRPDGSAVSEVMPFTSLRHMSDAELEALFAYLKSLQPRPFGQR
jgi:mono/diheme cytochrome c family protein